MSDRYESKYDGEIFINDPVASVKCIAKFDTYCGLTISISNSREGINLDVFNRNIIARYVENILPITDKYVFSGPNLGLYHDTSDPREGPFVNHWFQKLDIEILYEIAGNTIKVMGIDDLAKSGVDDYWYKGARKGEWKFSLKFTMPNDS